MSTKIITRAPKRRIERFGSRGNNVVSTSANSVILHTAEDAKTLVSARYRLILNAGDSVVDRENNYVVDWALHVQPAATAVVTTSSGDVTDNPETMQLIARGRLSIKVSADGTNVNVATIDTDKDVIKAMRKLKEADRVTFTYISSVGDSNGAELCYAWDLHFKE